MSLATRPALSEAETASKQDPRPEDERRHKLGERPTTSAEERLRVGRTIEKWARTGVKRGEWTEANHHELGMSVTTPLVKAGADLLYEGEWNQDTVGGLNLVVNRKRKEWQEEKAGRWMLTTYTELSGPEEGKVYPSLAVVERACRTIKGPILGRPVHHPLDRRIRAHLSVCGLAYLVERWVQLKVREGGGEGWGLSPGSGHLRRSGTGGSSR